MKDYGKIIGKITSTPWMITPEALKMMLEIFDSHLSGTLVSFQEDDSEPKSRISRHGSVGVLSLGGPIFPKANLMTEMSGATSLEQFRSDFRSMMSDESIDSILLDIDSPGGLSDMVDEMATEIHEATKVKPVYAVGNTAMNSAAYYLGSQATKVYSTPSGQLGSIGTYMVHVDESELKEKVGVKETVIKAGRFKAATIEPLTADSHQYIQDHVNATNDLFVNAVARGRRTDPDNVRKNFGEGGVVPPSKALAAGMIDGIATYDEVINKLSQGGELSVVKPVTTNTSNDLVVRQDDERALEHSEPGTGTGGEPEPREAPEEGDPAIEGGWRVDSPPAAFETEELIVNREWLEARATSLGIDFNDETSDDELATNVTEGIDNIVVPISVATENAEKARAFAEQYPEQAAKIERLEAKDRKNEALAFAESYRTFGDDAKHGYSTVVREKLTDAHLKVSQRAFSTDDLKELTDSLAQKSAIVPLGEEGSSRVDGDGIIVPSTDDQEVRKQFAEAVESAMNEDNLSREAALAHVAEQNPELAKAYMESGRR